MPLGCRSGWSRRQGVGDPGGAQGSFAGVNTGGPPRTLRISGATPRARYLNGCTWRPRTGSRPARAASSLGRARRQLPSAQGPGRHRRPVDGAGLIRVHGPTSSAAGSRRTTWPDTAWGHAYSESTPMSSTRCSPSSLQQPSVPSAAGGRSRVDW